MDIRQWSIINPIIITSPHCRIVPRIQITISSLIRENIMLGCIASHQLGSKYMCIYVVTFALEIGRLIAYICSYV